MISEIQVSYRPTEEKGPVVKSSAEAYEVLSALYNPDLLELREEFIVLYLNRANQVKGSNQISSGGLTGTVADLRLILAIALKTASCCIILSHNHPSGNLKPSDADISLTEKINESCRLMDIKLLDHLIITGGVTCRLRTRTYCEVGVSFPFSVREQ